MTSAPVLRIAVVLAVSISVSVPTQAQNKIATVPTERSYDSPQPEKERIDANAYLQIREEGIGHSHVMEYASGLMDGIGARLTGSPNLKKANEWTRDQLTAVGCSNAHLEDWGEFGMGWYQLNAAVRMIAPDNEVFVAQASPWSSSTNGSIRAPVVWVDLKEEKDFEEYKGKLSGKIVLFGKMRDVKPVERPLSTRLDENDLKRDTEYPLNKGNGNAEWQEHLKQLEFRERVGHYFAEERVAAVLIPSGDSADGGGSGGTIFVDTGATLGGRSYERQHANPVPTATLAIEHYGRVYRLLKAGVPVQLEVNLETGFTGDHEHGLNTVAEIPGTDPAVKDEVVMLGAHLDSWAAGTGATDNGAGTVVAMEVMRILNAIHFRPRRTVRVALWTGEEEGELGSYGYVKHHLAFVPRSTAAEQMKLTEYDRDPAGPIQLFPEYYKVSAYFNLDHGGGKIRGIWLQKNIAVASIFAQWIEPLKDLGVTTLSMRETGGTDNDAFDEVGIPGFQFIQDPLDYWSRAHHSNMDLYERLVPEDLAQAAVVEATFVYNAAMRDLMLPRKPFPHPELDEEHSKPLKSVMRGAPANVR
jgi:hypothetical protein